MDNGVEIPSTQLELGGVTDGCGVCGDAESEISREKNEEIIRVYDRAPDLSGLGTKEMQICRQQEGESHTHGPRMKWATSAGVLEVRGLERISVGNKSVLVGSAEENKYLSRSKYHSGGWFLVAMIPPQDGEPVDGCPLVRLTDSGDDMAFFLKAIFNYHFFEPWLSTPKFPVVAGILRLNQVDPLWKRAHIHLSEHCATSLEEAEELYDWEDAHPIELVNLAREVSADWLLPAAVAGCCWLDPTVLVHGVPANVGRTTALTLSPADVVLCLRAAVAVHTTWSSNLVDFMWEPLRIPGCTAPDECLEARLRCRREVEESRSNKVSVLCLWHDGLVRRDR
ncbi:hypothetical protein C8R46DRAFT_1284148 [Mycena filopes]|nr:hypothetical protein C8R46DRAFT_1037934 [Mycena filopes]KAJ7161739.1 hypothetical protein C8R46DRAFT_1284148 [Mycena filopes]